MQIYESVQSAEWGLEPWIVTVHPEVVGYDARGQPLAFTVHRQVSQSWLGRLFDFRRENVRIAPAAAPAAPAALHALLVEYLRATSGARDATVPQAGSDAEAALQLPALVKAVARFARR